MPILREYQREAQDGVVGVWAREGVPLLVMATGTGKTVTFADLVRRHQGTGALVMAHRQELVGQMSLTLGAYGVRHAIMAPDAVRRSIERLHLTVLGRRWVDQSARVLCAGVDTIIRRPSMPDWIDLAVVDEAHHVQSDNKWGKALSMLRPDCKLLGVTAWPGRSDGKGLDGVFTDIVAGPSMRDSINDGMLTDYRIFCPPNDLHMENVPLGASGDYQAAPMVAEVKRAKITGSVVSTYLQHCRGKRGITFAVSVEAARELVDEYRTRGVPAALLTADNSVEERSRVMEGFRSGELLQLVNVDILGEGVDVPACEVVSMARPTKSLQLFIQQFGRALRLMIPDELRETWGTLGRDERLAAIAGSAKPRATIIDHVGNCLSLGLPDAPRPMSLEGRDRRSRPPVDAIPLTRCTECTSPYPRALPACPYCGHRPVPRGRSTPQEVDGDLLELSPDVLARLRGESDRIMSDTIYLPAGLSGPAQIAAERMHLERRDAQRDLGEAIADWRARYRDGASDSECYRAFFHLFGVDVATARTLGRPEAVKLAERIRNA